MLIPQVPSVPRQGSCGISNNGIGESMTVFITQEVPGRDITKASEYGDLQILIPAKEQVALSAQPTVRRINRLLRKFNDKDYLLLSGDPVIIGISCAVAMSNNIGKLNILKWDRQDEEYYPVTVDIYDKEV